jgi:ribosomal protein S12 methylthiotransferase accessory factor
LVNDPTQTGRAPRLTSVELREFRDGSTLATTPGGEMYLIDAEPEFVERLLCGFTGHRTVSEVLSGFAGDRDVSELVEVIEVLEAAGVLGYGEQPAWAHSLDSSNGEPDPGRPASACVLIVADDAMTAAVSDRRLTSRFGSVEIIGSESLEEAFSGRRSGEKTGSTIVVALREVFDSRFLSRLDELCEAHGIPWTQFHLDQGKGWSGPSVVPGSTANYRDLLGRRLCAAEDVEVFEALGAPPTRLGEGPLSTAELLWMLSFFFVDVERWLAGAPAQTLGNEVELDPVSLTFTPHPVLPLPDRRLGDAAPRGDARTLVDARTGFITEVMSIDHHPSVPSELRTVQTRVADMRRLYPWANNDFCGGSAFDDYYAARDAAIGESVERYCGNWAQGAHFTKVSYDELVSQDEHAVDPERLILYSKRQYSTPGFPFVPFTRDLRVHWVRGWSLTSDRPAWLPASLVYVNWYVDRYGDEPAVNFMNYPGIQAGPSLDYALASAIEEIVERDATMVWWMNRQPLPAVRHTPVLSGLWEGTPAELGQRAWLIYLDNEFDIPVMAGVVENVEEKLLNIGFAARPSPGQAALKAWTEALTLQEGSRDLLNPQGLYRQAAERGEVNDYAMKPWREDRAYLDSYRQDFRDVNDLMCQQQVFLDARAQDFVRSWVHVEAARNFDELPELADRSSSAYRERVESRGYEIFYADITTPDIEMVGMKVVRVLVPGLAPNFPAAFPCLGGGRIQDAAVQLGWRREPLREEELNYFPLPHA